MGNAIILYLNDLKIWPLNISLKALVRPHPGHGIWNIVLNTQSISKINTTSIANTSSIINEHKILIVLLVN